MLMYTQNPLMQGMLVNKYIDTSFNMKGSCDCYTYHCRCIVGTTWWCLVQLLLLPLYCWLIMCSRWRLLLLHQQLFTNIKINQETHVNYINRNFPIFMAL